MAILVTGATGYIGSHTAVALLEKEYTVVGVDDFSNSSPKVLERIEMITGSKMHFYQGDVKDRALLEMIFEKESIDAVIHFAACKSVGESVQNPLKYYHDNLVGILSLCEIMEKNNVTTLAFSSSATVYGDQNAAPFREDMSLESVNPYGQTKVMSERILSDLYSPNSRWGIIALRYFNPTGAHPSGLIGENPNGIPSNLMPYITQVAANKRDCLSVFGNQYDTPDGTGIRDYIHVQDLALGHIRALEYLEDHHGFETFNLGSNKGHSVIEVIRTFEKVTGIAIPYRIAKARLGDVAVSYANCEKAFEQLDWRCQRGLEDMCRDAWNWQVKNPDGYV